MLTADRLLTRDRRFFGPAFRGLNALSPDEFLADR